MYKQLNYNYSKKQGKPIRVAYVPKNTLNVGYNTNNKSNNSNNIYDSRTQQHSLEGMRKVEPIVYKSSIPKTNRNDIINNAFDGSLYKQQHNDDNDIIKKADMVFSHKTVSSILFNDTSLELNYPITKDRNATDFLLDYVKPPPKDVIAELQFKLCELIKKNNISKIVNVYQQSYKENKKATGFGDFLRGNYYLMQFCAGLNIHYEINMSNHPLSFYLKNKTVDTHDEDTYTTICQNIEQLSGNNFVPNIDQDNTILFKPQNNFIIDFMLYLLTNCPLYENTNTNTNKNTNKNTNIQYIYTIAYPPQEIISENHKMYMRHILEPTIEMQLYVQNTISLLHMREKEYITIHIRSGDQSLIGGLPVSKHFLSKIKNEIMKIMRLDRSRQYLLLTDNNELKTVLVETFPQLKIVINEISHSGEGIVLTESAVKNTMLDLYLLAKSCAIFSLSCYSHGSGFSKWTAETYNIPYICKFVEYEANTETNTNIIIS